MNDDVILAGQCFFESLVPHQIEALTLYGKFLWLWSSDRDDPMLSMILFAYGFHPNSLICFE
jgi:hypothetical protein